MLKLMTATFAVVIALVTQADARPTPRIDLSNEFCGSNYCGQHTLTVRTQRQAAPEGRYSRRGHREARHREKRTHGHATQVVGHPPGCGYVAFCGCGVSVKVFGRPVRDLFLASNWFRFPAAAAAPGMVAVRNHHVFYIEAVLGNGMVLAYDPNSGGHQTRIHPRSLSGYSVRNPNGGRVAMR